MYKRQDLKPLFETILEYIPAPEADVDQPFQMLVSSIDYNEFVGRIAIGRIERGTVKVGQEVSICDYHDPDIRQKGKIAELALGYGGSVGALKAMGALDMGLSEEELPPLVDAWRQANPNITKLWWDVDRAAMVLSLIHISEPTRH